MAGATGRTIANKGLLKVQLGDQTDAKVLIGTYHSTDVPGEFVWTAGVLTEVGIDYFFFIYQYHFWYILYQVFICINYYVDLLLLYYHYKGNIVS